MENLSGFPFFPLEFDRQGALVKPEQLQELLDALPGVTDLITISHGWNNDMTDAHDLYARFFQSAAKWKNQPGLGLTDRNFAVAGIFWPSKKFTDADLIPGGAASLDEPERAAVLAGLDLLQELHNGEEQHRKIEEAKAAVDDLAASPDLQDEWVKTLIDLIDDQAAADREEEGITALRDAAGRDVLERLSAVVRFPVAVVDDGMGGAASIGAGTGSVDDQGSAAGLGSLLSGTLGGAAKLLNLLTYYTMKERAGVVGAGGVHDALVKAMQTNPALRLHLVGHSFGGRLVTAAAKGRTGAPPLSLASLCLLQAAFSHYGFAGNAANTGKPGFFRGVLTDGILRGPGIVTHSRWDYAVGYAYAIASRVSGVNAAALGDQNDPYGGIGRNGAQVTPEADFADLQPAGAAYAFPPAHLHNLNGGGDDKQTSLIQGHSDITSEAVAYACLSAMKG